VKKVFGRKSLPVGVLVMLLVLALASLGMGYGLWSKVLTIDGTVNTGEVNAEFSLMEIDESRAFDGDYCPDFPGSYSIGKDCDGLNGLNDDMEVDDKDIATCTVELLDGLENPGPQTLKVTIDKAYPSFNCFIRYDVKNTGSIPIKVHLPDYSGIPATLHVNTWPPFCYADHEQVEPGFAAYCNLHIHVPQGAEQNATYTFNVPIFVHQWNEP